MNKKTIEILLNPIVMKIIIEMLKKQDITTKEIQKEVAIPQATLYRYIAKLEKNKIIKVVKEAYKRGSYEKTYRLIYDPIQEMGKIATEGSIEDKQNLFLMFMMNIVGQYNQYIEDPSSNMVEDQTGFRTYPLYMTNEENENFIKDFGDLLTKYISSKNSEDKTLYNFSFVHIKGGK